MLASMVRAALRRRPFSALCTVALGVVYASFLGVPVPLALLVWAACALLGIELWLILERIVLERLGCRTPVRAEQHRLESVMRQFRVDVRVAADPAPWIGSTLRSLVISQGALDLLEDRGLLGLLGQAATQRQAMGLVGEWIVWLGNAPLLLAYTVDRGLGLLGRLLAVVLGCALVVPMLLWPRGFVRGVGRALGAVLVGVVGAVLISGGLAAAGLGLVLAWAVVPGVRALLAWEARRIEADADCAMVRDGLGRQLLEGLQMLACIGTARPKGALGLIVRPGASFMSRIDRVERALDAG
jgi:hypothetical protein